MGLVPVCPLLGHVTDTVHVVFYSTGDGCGGPTELNHIWSTTREYPDFPELCR